MLNEVKHLGREREVSIARERSQHRTRRDVRRPSRRAGIRSVQDDNHHMISDEALGH